MEAETLGTGRDGRLLGRLWSPASASSSAGVVIVVHGLGDHSGRFEHFANRLSAANFAVFAFDLPGHGRSPGRRGHFRRYRHVLADIAAARETVAQRLPGVPQFLLGHSMGGNLAINYVLRYANHPHSSGELAGLVLAAPMLLPPDPPPRPHILAAWLTGFLVPWIKVRRTFDSPAGSEDADAASQDRDELLHGEITIYAATQLLAQGRWALDHARHIHVPTLVMDCEDDTMIDRAASRNVAIRMGSNAVHHSFASGGHNLLHFGSGPAAIDLVMQWLGRPQGPIHPHVP